MTGVLTGRVEDDPPERPLERRTWDAATLMAEHPPRWRNPSKEAIARIACPPGFTASGTLAYSRWPELPMPASVGMPPNGLVEIVPGFFDYKRANGARTDLEWHLNFAAPDLFAYYAGGSLAQDEYQVAEHPALASVRESLIAEGAIARTVSDGRPTPVLVRDVERRVCIDTGPNAAAGRPEGIYGYRFRKVGPEVIAGATTAIVPPSRSNILAIAALPREWGAYTEEQVELTLATAYSGFRAAVLESANCRAGQVVIHTGYWGCGAFGGNRELLALLQVAAAVMAGVDRLKFHAAEPDGYEPLQAAMRAFDEMFRGGEVLVKDLRSALLNRGYRWRDHDGY